MRKIKWLLKAVAFSLSVILVIQILPLSSLAAELNNRKYLEQEALDNLKEYTPDIIEEVVELRSENIKHFRREDGSYVAAVYSEPVHYQKNGEWKNISNELKVNNNTVQTNKHNDAKYTVTETSTPLSFPENINTGKITINKNGNTISFGAKGNSNIASVATLSDPEELVSASIASIQAESITVDETQAKIAADTGTSAITYSNAFNNAALEYEISSSVVKESIVVNKRSESYRYEFSIDFGNFIPICDELTGGIYIYETIGSVEPVMAITPPYMFDANGEKSEEVTMQLIPNQNDYTLVVEADAGWINNIFRKFPVVIDPTIDLDIAKKNVDDIHVNQNKPNRSYKLDYQLEVGRNNNNLFRTYIKYILPELPDCSIVTDAKLTLVQNWSRDFDATDIYLNVYQCQSEWDFSSITWNTQPIQNLSTAPIVDYTNFVGGMSAEYNLNITKIVKDWYENGKNYGLMLALSDESVEEKTSFYATRNIVSKYPSLIVSYVNNTGVEDYWDYETISLGKSGTAYVNLYNGELTYIHNDVTTNGLVMPASVSHVYNMSERNASGTFNGMNFGKRFKLNVMEQIEECDIDGYPYKYIDGDGTVHFFKETATQNRYEYEFDSSIILEAGTSSSATMRFADGSIKNFWDGFLVSESDPNSNLRQYGYDTKLLLVSDGGALNVTFGYDANKRLVRIGDPADRLTNYTYNSNGMLTAITYPDGTSTQYTYDGNLLLEKIICFDGSSAEFKYKARACGEKTIYRVSQVILYGVDGTKYNELNLTYNTNETIISNSMGDTARLSFDSTGKTVSCIKNEETISVSRYSSLDENSNPNAMNKAVYNSNSFTPRENLDLRYEYSKAKVNVPYFNPYLTEHRSKYRVCVEENSEPNSSYYCSGSDIYEAGKTYTFSAYVNIVNTLSAGSFYLNAEVFNGEELIGTVKSEEIITTDNCWKRLSVTVTVPEGTSRIITNYGIFDGKGIAYLKDFATEESEVAGSVNLLHNSSFNSYGDITLMQGWRFASSGKDKTVNPADSTGAFIIYGNPNSANNFDQIVEIENGKPGDTLVFGASAMALCSASGNNGNRFFGLRIKLMKDDAQVQDTVLVKFNADAYNTMQTVMSYVTAEEEYDSVIFEIAYDYEINSAIFDDAFLYRDSFATYYEYDGQGRIEKISDDNGNLTQLTRANNDITGITVSSNGQVLESAEYAYDANHNLLSASGSDGITTSYVYNIDGMPTSITVSDEAGQSSTTTYEYGANSHYITEVTDPSGAVTQYNYDKNGIYRLGLITSVIDPNGNKTEYTYDPNNDNLLSVHSPQGELYPLTTEFTYNSQNLLSGISTEEELSGIGISYSLNYDALGRNVSAQAEGNTLVTNAYNDKLLPQGSTFANGDTVEYIYNDKKLLSGEKYNGVLTYAYNYSPNGRLGKTTDYENNVVWEYQYDLAGRLRQAYGSNKISADYIYNSKNQLEKFVVAEDKNNLLSTEYAYDEDNRPSSVTIGSMANSPVQSYAYDSFGRTQSITSTYDGTNTITNSYTYLTNGENQTGRVGSVSYAKTTAEGSSNILPTLSYAYDANGNITHVYENGVQKIKYYYDGLNRLIREDNEYLDKTETFNYYRNGDIAGRAEYELTSAESVYNDGIFVKADYYNYDDSRFPNGITKFNNDTITYDANGNPLTYRGYTMNWEKGRQLESMTDGTNTLSFKYDSSGIRTSKTVNGTQTKFTYIGTTLVSQKTGTEVINFAYSAGGSPYGFTYNGTSYFYLLNLQGDVIGIYDSNGNIVVQYLYDSWGKLVSITGSLADTIGIKNPLRYRGYYYDTETSLYYLQSRYYAPETCRFINADSLLIAGDYLQGTNMFAYCLNNPVMYVDPTGHANEELAADIITVIACLCYIGEYAKRNGKDINAVSDFVGRTLDEEPLLDDVVNTFLLGTLILMGRDLFEAILSIEGIAGDLSEIASTALTKSVEIDFSSSVFGVIKNVLTDFYNPLVFDDEIRLNIPIYIMEAAVGVGIGVFTLELSAAVSTLTGNPLFGAGVGVIFYGFSTIGIDYFL